ncbi:hypothetical protein MRB53_020902 [Persea americana]|uniref:Uncharacterized protein n=1 Tax=Persea americana TaxID=3435 RepID=A0ACC2L2N9_PERAE|nr:hypothetical protein MRB53_020902 [Persea americana]
MGLPPLLFILTLFGRAKSYSYIALLLLEISFAIQEVRNLNLSPLIEEGISSCAICWDSRSCNAHLEIVDVAEVRQFLWFKHPSDILIRAVKKRLVPWQKRELGLTEMFYAEVTTHPF